MDRLILLRHGKAEPDSDSGEDFDRRLAPRGVEESLEVATRLAEMGFQPDLALVSTAARAKGTWEAAQPSFPAAQTRFAANLYHADSGAIRAAAEKAGETCGTLIVVGHNPGMQELSIQLLLEGHAPAGLIARARRSFPTAAAAVFLFDGAGRPQYDGLFFPEGRY
ncbi:MAG: histidine phosphatase family protein [Pseudomonadota bacterium]